MSHRKSIGIIKEYNMSYFINSTLIANLFSIAHWHMDPRIRSMRLTRWIFRISCQEFYKEVIMDAKIPI
jgi:hypothetical protein